MKLTIDDLANLAIDSMGSCLSEVAMDSFLEMTPVEQIRYRYLHGDCDDFALVLHRAIGLPVVSATSKHGFVHRLNQLSDGQLLDASGIVTKTTLEQRYKNTLTLKTGGEELLMAYCSNDDQEMEIAIQSILTFDCGLSELGLRGNLFEFAQSLGISFEVPKNAFKKSNAV